MSVLVNVPFSVGRSIVTEWLRAKSVVQLDVAYCGGSERKPMLELLSGSIALDVDSDFSKPPNCVDRLRWMAARNVNCHSFTFYGDDLSAAAIPVFSAFFRNTAETLKVVRVDSDDIGLMILLGHIATNQCSLRILDADSTDAPGVGRTHVDDALSAIVRNSNCELTEFSLCQVGSKSCFATDVLCSALSKVDVKIRCDQDLIDLCRAAPNLKELELSWPICTVAGMVAIGQHCQQLEKLLCAGSFAGVENLDEGIEAVVIGCRKLKVIELESCPELTDIGLTAIATHCTQLEEFLISENDHISDAPLIALAQSVNAGSLSSISVEYCAGVTGTGIVALATHCPLLHTLSVRELAFAEPSYMRTSLALLKQLKSLNVCDCAVNDDLLQLIAENMPLLEDLCVDMIHDAPLFTSDGLMHIALKCNHLKFLLICDGVLTPMEVALWQTLRPGMLFNIE